MMPLYRVWFAYAFKPQPDYVWPTAHIAESTPEQAAAHFEAGYHVLLAHDVEEADHLAAVYAPTFWRRVKGPDGPPTPRKPEPDADACELLDVEPEPVAADCPTRPIRRAGRVKRIGGRSEGVDPRKGASQRR